MAAIGSAQVTSSNGVLHCSEHSSAGPLTCEHIIECIKQGYDAEWVHIGMTFDVPVFPAAEVWAQVTIDNIGYADIGLMWLVYYDDLNIDRTVSLGHWTKGEGRLSVRSGILDYIRGKIDEKEDFAEPKIWTRCPSNIHNFDAQKLLDENENPAFKQACMWYIAMEDACLPCVTMALPDKPDLDPDMNRLNPQGRRGTYDFDLSHTTSVVPAPEHKGMIGQVKPGDKIIFQALDGRKVHLDNGRSFGVNHIQIMNKEDETQIFLTKEEVIRLGERQLRRMRDE